VRNDRGYPLGNGRRSDVCYLASAEKAFNITPTVMDAGRRSATWFNRGKQLLRFPPLKLCGGIFQTHLAQLISRNKTIVFELPLIRHNVAPKHRYGGDQNEARYLAGKKNCSGLKGCRQSRQSATKRTHALHNAKRLAFLREGWRCGVPNAPSRRAFLLDINVNRKSLPFPFVRKCD
jgi:hypothetical protein